MSTKKKTETISEQERYSKSAFLTASLNDRDALDALLDEETLYTQEEVEALLTAYKSKEVH